MASVVAGPIPVVVLVILLLIIQVGAVALTLTSVAEGMGRFLARSAFLGGGREERGAPRGPRHADLRVSRKYSMRAIHAADLERQWEERQQHE